MAVIALALLLGSSLGVHEDIEGAAVELAEVVDLEAAPMAGGSLTAGAPCADPRGGAGDKGDQPQGVLVALPALDLRHAQSEPPAAPPQRRPALAQPERLLRPPNA